MIKTQSLWVRHRVQAPSTELIQRSYKGHMLQNMTRKYNILSIEKLHTVLIDFILKYILQHPVEMLFIFH